MALKFSALTSFHMRRSMGVLTGLALVMACLAGPATAGMCDNGKFAMKGTKLNLAPGTSSGRAAASNDRATLAVGQAATMASDWEEAAGQAARRTFNSQSQAMQQNGQDLTGNGTSSRASAG